MSSSAVAITLPPAWQAANHGSEPLPPSAASGTAGVPARDLRGDLDNIVLKSLQKEPQRRYGSVNHFCEDIRRYLDGHPVVARKDTLAYRAGKFTRRHRVGVVAGALQG